MGAATDAPIPSIATNTQESPNTTSERCTISSYRHDSEPSNQPTYTSETRKQIHTEPSSREPSFLITLPPEIIFRILSHMQPEDYAGLAMTCRLALKLTNNQVQLEHQTPVWVYFHDFTDIYLSEQISLARIFPTIRRVEWELQQPVCSLGEDFGSEEGEVDYGDDDDLSLIIEL